MLQASLNMEIDTLYNTTSEIMKTNGSCKAKVIEGSGFVCKPPPGKLIQGLYEFAFSYFTVINLGFVAEATGRFCYCSSICAVSFQHCILKPSHEKVWFIPSCYKHVFIGNTCIFMFFISASHISSDIQGRIKHIYVCLNKWYWRYHVQMNLHCPKSIHAFRKYKNILKCKA